MRGVKIPVAVALLLAIGIGIDAYSGDTYQRQRALSGAAPGANATVYQAAEVLHGTGLKWGMTKEEVEHVLHMHISSRESLTLDLRSRANGTFEGLPAYYWFDFSNVSRLSGVVINIKIPGGATAQKRFNHLPSDFVNWYGRPVRLIHTRSVTGAGIAYYIWVTPRHEVDLLFGPNVATGLPNAFISAERRIQPNDAVTVSAKKLATLPIDGVLYVNWAGMPVAVIRRSSEEIARLKLAQVHRKPRDQVHQNLLSYQFPLSQSAPFTRTAVRSVRPELGVYLAIDTLHGCPLRYEDLSQEPKIKSAKTPIQRKGFFTSCYDLAYDSAGWPLPPHTDLPPLMIPKYHFEANGTLVIGK